MKTGKMMTAAWIGMAMVTWAVAASAITCWQCSNGKILKWAAPQMRLRASSVSFPAGNFWTDALTTSVDLWNRNPSAFRINLTTGDGNIDYSNDQSEVWFTNDLEEDVGGVTHQWWDPDDCNMVETDIEFSIKVDLTDGLDAVSQSGLNAYDATPLYFFRPIALHELGHVLGFGESGECYGVMGMSPTHLSTNCRLVRTYPGEDASFGAVFLYGAGATPVTDVGVSHWKYAGLIPQGEYSLHWRTVLYDAGGNALPTVPTPEVPDHKSTRFHDVTYRVDNGAPFLAEFTYESNGNDTQSSVPVRFVLSADECIQTSDRRIGDTWFTLGLGCPTTFTTTLRLPNDLAESHVYMVGAIIDPLDAIAEVEDDNNACGIRVLINTVSLKDLTVTPTTVAPGDPATGTVYLSAPATAGGVVVHLSVDAPLLASVPPDVTVPVGALSATFPITTSGTWALCRNFCTIAASRGDVTLTKSLGLGSAGGDFCHLLGDPWLEVLEHAYICVDFSGGEPHLPGEGGGHGGRCPQPPGCPECIYSLAGEVLELPPYLRDLEQTLFGILNNPGRPAPSGPSLQKIRSYFEAAPLGRYYNEGVRGDALQALGTFSQQKGLTTETASAFAKALQALELDVRVPPITPQRPGADANAQVDFAGVATARVSGLHKAGTMTLRVETGRANEPSGFTGGWPFVSHRLDFDGILAPDGQIDITFNLRGINFFGDPRNLRVFAWDGRRYRDVTTSLDLADARISARIAGAATMVIVNRIPGTDKPEKESRIARP